MGRRSARDKPIFMDASGKRRRLFTMVAAAAGVLMATAVVILVAGFVGPSSGHLPGLPDFGPGQQEVARVPPPTPTASSTGGAPRIRPSTAPPASSTSDTKGNNGNGNVPSHRPDHPRPTKSK